jgi:1-deoxy-D-xylulose-5-phosphate synthase
MSSLASLQAIIQPWLPQLSARRRAAERQQSLLQRATEPAELRRLHIDQLEPLAAELRDYLIESVSRSGGHLAAGLGVVELTIALHYVYDTPRDSLVWDVGHQSYPHKILTGRRDSLHSIRRQGGLSGFQRRSESLHDAFGAGHSSTSISAALGMALANVQLGLTDRSVAIIGDGGLTAGLAYEALQHAGSVDADLLVIVNDNGMSISPNVGAMSRYLGRLAESKSTLHDCSRRHDGHLARLLEIAERAERRDRGLALPGQLFEDLGFRFTGPVDGHDLPALARVLRKLRDIPGPKLLHVVTRKGEGYAPAVAEPVKYHGVTTFDPAVGIRPAAKSATQYTQVFGDWLCDTAATDPRVCAITPAMREGSGLVAFEQRYPQRYHDVSIAEQHAVTLAAGLATRGQRPVVAIYSTFLQRAYDQLIHDVALQNLPVLFAIDRAGVVGPDGATHNGAFDLSFLRCIPNLVVMAPSDGAELRDMLRTGLSLDGPSAVRYPRAAIPDADVTREARRLQVGVAEWRREGAGTAFLSFGTMLGQCLALGDELDATVVNMRFVKPLDEAAIVAAARSHGLLVTVEENAVAGGAGSAVAECLARHGLCVPLLQIGLPDRYPEHGTRDEVLAEAGLDLASIRRQVSRRLELLAESKTSSP